MRVVGLGLILALAALGAGRPAARWDGAQGIPVFIQASDAAGEPAEMVRRALRTWGEASAGRLRFEEAAAPPRRGMRIWFGAGDRAFGEAAPELDRDGRITSADVILATDLVGDALQKRLILYLTALHELGHALGLEHTDEWDSIMYRFQRPTDATRYFLRYRRSLAGDRDVGSPGASGLFPRDLAALRSLYRPAP
jgi:hypothetical protein